MLVGTSAAFGYAELSPDAEVTTSANFSASLRAQTPVSETPSNSPSPTPQTETPSPTPAPNPSPSAKTPGATAEGVKAPSNDSADPPIAALVLNPVTLAPEATTPKPPSPPRTGQPSASNTGVPAGTSLLRVDGDLVITKPGTVIDSIDLHGAVRIEAANVTIKRSILRGSSSVGAVVVYAGLPQVSNLVLEDDEISPTVKSMYTNGVYGHDFTLTRVNIHDVVDSAHVFNGNNVLIQNSYLHDNTHFGPEIDTGHPDGSHDDNVQVQSGRNITIRNSVLSGAHNAAVQVTQGLGTVGNLSIQNNWVSGGGCALNIAEGNYGTISGLTITDNRFGATGFNCPILLTAATKAISNISGNDLNSGAPVSLICRTSSANVHC